MIDFRQDFPPLTTTETVYRALADWLALSRDAGATNDQVIAALALELAGVVGSAIERGAGGLLPEPARAKLLAGVIERLNGHMRDHLARIGKAAESCH